MRVSAKADYGVRAMVVLAARGPAGDGPVKLDEIARTAAIPPKFLEAILVQLRRAGLVGSKRGADGGYWMTRPAHEVSVAEIVRAIDGPLALVAGRDPDDLTYPAGVGAIADAWRAAAAAQRAALEDATLDRLVTKAAVLDFQI